MILPTPKSSASATSSHHPAADTALFQACSAVQDHLTTGEPRPTRETPALLGRPKDNANIGRSWVTCGSQKRLALARPGPVPSAKACLRARPSRAACLAYRDFNRRCPTAHRQLPGAHRALRSSHRCSRADPDADTDTSVAPCILSCRRCRTPHIHVSSSCPRLAFILPPHFLPPNTLQPHVSRLPATPLSKSAAAEGRGSPWGAKRQGNHQYYKSILALFKHSTSQRTTGFNLCSV
ncbi:hypothetical protein C8R47DRAFT_478983 [Mycena vitilis]|nr:hypothetical protein C8R47DRAFT_478983 [Mycena vitilis]